MCIIFINYFHIIFFPFRAVAFRFFLPIPRRFVDEKGVWSRPPQWHVRLNHEVVRSSKRVGRDWPGLLTVGLISSLALSPLIQRIHLPFAQFFRPFCCKFPSLLPFWLLISVSFFLLAMVTQKHTQTIKSLVTWLYAYTERETHQALELGQIRLISQTATSPHHQR